MKLKKNIILKKKLIKNSLKNEILFTDSLSCKTEAIVAWDIK